jgi:glycosyltransferase involved in cell wall biosynthesis
MRIAQVAPPLESVPPRRYGGTERVVSALTEELVRRGHDVTLFAAGDSRTRARLVPVVPRALWHAGGRGGDFAPFTAIALGKVAPRLGEFDVVHSHLDYHGFPLARAALRPVVTTLHGRLDLPGLAPLYREFRDVPLVSISDAQREPVPDANWVATVHHGVVLDDLAFNGRPGDYLAFLGRIAPEKGVDTAIRVAQRAGMPLQIAGRMPLPYKDDPEARRDWEYYEGEVGPLLRGRRGRARFVGEVGDRRKSTFLRNAAALLFPIRWPEPFGLVIVEALACGTPVVALRAGSVPELIEHGVTGFVCDDEDELVAAVGRLGEIDRARCRAEAERRFTPAAMADGYERAYAALVGAAAPTEIGPRACPPTTERRGRATGATR